MENLKKRLYALVIYQLSGRQGGIQAGHCAQEYDRKYGKDDPESEVWKFIDNHKTWYVMNGGTTNDGSKILKEDDGTPYRGTLNKDIDKLEKANVKHVIFREPDLGDVITACVFLCDERVFNKDEYPDFYFPKFKEWLYKKQIPAYTLTLEKEAELKNEYDTERKSDYEKFVNKVGVEIATMKEVLENKRFF